MLWSENGVGWPASTSGGRVYATGSMAECPPEKAILGSRTGEWQETWSLQSAYYVRASYFV